jgi:hypothetical protein
MSQEKKDQNKESEQSQKSSTDSLQNQSQEQKAKFAQGGQPAGHTQGGQGGNQQPHGGKNPLQDQGDELSEFAREDS